MKEKENVMIAWGKPKALRIDIDLIAQYTNYKSSDEIFKLNEKTLVDLDFYSFYKFVDRTSSSVGQQCLYHKLISQSDSKEKLEKQEQSVKFYNSNLDKKLNSQLALKKLANPNDYYFPYLIFSALPERMYNYWIILFLQVAMVLSVVLCFKYPIFFLSIILLFTVNISLHYLHKNRIGNFTVYFSRLTNLSNTLRKILPISNVSEHKQSNLQSDIKHIDKITSQVLFLKTDNLQNSEFGSVFWFVFEIFKIITLSEITVFNKLVDKIRVSRPQIENVCTAIGEIDIAISICSLRDGLPYYSIPTFEKQSKELEVKALYHPLVTDCIANDIALQDKSLLLTGSNMAGKSTFIKAVNLNALSSQVLNTSFTNYYKAPIWKLMTSMNIKDQLEEDSSYYMEEVNSIGQLITCSEESDKRYLFTIDEIFKGTNTIERISTAKAILQYLNKSEHLVLVSTHDIELTKLLQEGFDLYFFQESITDKTLSFDYKIKKGTLEKSNAISILEIVGYPRVITEEARALAEKLKNEKTGERISGICTLCYRTDILQ